MEKIPSFNELIQKSIIANWDMDALTDYIFLHRESHRQFPFEVVLNAIFDKPH